MVKQLLFIPGPVTCAPEVLAALASPLIDHRGPEFAALLAEVSSAMQPLFGTSSEILLLGSSGTGGLEAAVANSFSPGQKILACPVGVFGKRLANIARTFGLEVEVLAPPSGERVDAGALAARLEAPGGSDFAGILLTHNETSTGVQNDMAQLAAAIGGHPATVVVDSVSGLGATAFEMDAWNFDIVVTASQKVVAAPPGVALVAVSARAWERMAAASASRFYLDLTKAREFARDGQTPWTPPVSIVFALAEALRRYAREGAPRVYARHERYARTIRAYADAAGLTLFSAPGAHSVTVVALRAPAGLDVASVRNALRERYGVVLGGGQAELKGKLLRMGTMGDLAHADLLFGLSALDDVLRERGVVSDEGLGAARRALDGDLAAAL